MLRPALCAVVLAALVGPHVFDQATVLTFGQVDQPWNLEDAQRALYNGDYEVAEQLTSSRCSSATATLDVCEVQSAAILFQIRRAMGDGQDRKVAWQRCGRCPALMAAFEATFTHGKTLARARLRVQRDDETLFLLSRLNLNYLWLQLGLLGRKTGWGEYWDARRTLDGILERRPDHVRARVARAWIDYIVDTKMPRGTRWLLGGGNKARGLLMVRQAAESDTDFFVRVEARFALWDMQVRERNIPGALGVARSLAQDFPGNSELARFIDTHANQLPQ
jgi:hypothetical protein